MTRGGGCATSQMQSESNMFGVSGCSRRDGVTMAVMFAAGLVLCVAVSCLATCP